MTKKIKNPINYNIYFKLKRKIYQIIFDINPE